MLLPGRVQRRRRSAIGIVDLMPARFGRSDKARKPGLAGRNGNGLCVRAPIGIGHNPTCPARQTRPELDQSHA